MIDSTDAMLVRTLRSAAQRLSGAATDYDPLMELVEPLERLATVGGEVEETFPSGV